MQEHATAQTGPRPVVLFTASSGWVVRNFFRSGLASEVGTFADIGVAASPPLLPFFEDLRAAGAVSFVVALPAVEDPVKKRLRQAKKAVLQARHNISTANIQWRRRGRTRRAQLLRSALWIIGRLLAANWQITVLEALERWYPTRATVPMPVTPSLVVNCSPFSFPDNEIQRQLQRRGIPAAAVIPSWDNPSSKGCILSRSDWVFVWGPHQKEEIRRFYPSIAAERLVISGAPQFDPYRQELLPKFSRSQFLSGLGIDPSARVILYATGNPRNQPGEPLVVSAIASAVAADRFGTDVHLLVRCHPADDVERYKEIDGVARVTIFPPSVQACTRSAVGDAQRYLGSTHLLLTWVPPQDETLTLAATLRHSEVCINVASTMTLDALASEVPAINVRYDGTGATVPFLDSVRRYYDQEHYLPVTRSGAVPLVNSEDELLRAIAQALAEPRHRLERERALVAQLCAQPAGGTVPLIAREIRRITAPSSPVQRRFGRGRAPRAPASEPGPRETGSGAGSTSAASSGRRSEPVGGSNT